MNKLGDGDGFKGNGCRRRQKPTYEFIWVYHLFTPGEQRLVTYLRWFRDWFDVREPEKMLNDVDYLYRIHLVIRKLVLAARSSQTLRPACIAPVIPQALLQHRLRLAQILGALFAKFQLLNHSVYIVAGHLRQKLILLDLPFYNI